MNKLEKLLFLNQFFIILIVIGMACNSLVYKTNDGKMPVYMGYINKDVELTAYNEESNGLFGTEHFDFWNTDEINYPYLSDIIDTPFGKVFSIGDLLMTFGVLALFINIMLQIKYSWFRKDEKD